MLSRALGAICLGPTGSRQGGHWFMSLTSGARGIQYPWTELPIPTDVIQRVSNMERAQGMPSTLTYSNRRGEEIEDTIHDLEGIDDADDSTYASGDDLSIDDELLLDNDESSESSSTASEDDDGDNDDNNGDDGDDDGNNGDTTDMIGDAALAGDHHTHVDQNDTNIDINIKNKPIGPAPPET